MDDTSYRRIRDTLTLLKETDARTRVLFLMVKNLSVEIQELRKENTTVLTALRAVLDLPREDQHHAKAVMKDTQKHASHAYDKSKQ